jgi:hypothetical protein
VLPGGPGAAGGHLEAPGYDIQLTAALGDEMGRCVAGNAQGGVAESLSMGQVKEAKAKAGMLGEAAGLLPDKYQQQSRC